MVGLVGGGSLHLQSLIQSCSGFVGVLSLLIVRNTSISS